LSCASQHSDSCVVDGKSNDTPQAEKNHDSPKSSQHLTIGINAVTRRLERQVRSARHSVTISENGAAIVAPHSQPPIKFVFVCRADIDPPLLIAHLPHLVAACNSPARADGSSENLTVKLIQLPKGAEFTLAHAIGLRRAAAIAIDV
jgi:ribonuclease P/MRP protein subunit POP3